MEGLQKDLEAFSSTAKWHLSKLVLIIQTFQQNHISQEVIHPGLCGIKLHDHDRKCMSYGSQSLFQ